MEGEIVEVDMSRSMEHGEVEEIENNTLVEAEIEEVEGEIEAVVEAGIEEVEDRRTEAGIEEAGDHHDPLDVQQQLPAAPPLRMILPEPFSLIEGEIVEVDKNGSMESGEVEEIENITLVEAEIEEAEGEIEEVVEAGREEVEDRRMEAGIEEAGDIQQQLPAGPLLRMILLVAAIALGIQFVLALNLSHLTPYVQLIGIPHYLTFFIWLLGPILSLLVQPVVGYYSDNCRSRFGRRSPFIATGVALLAVSVFIIGYAIDLGHTVGDSSRKGPKPKAIDIFVVGYCMLNVANNILQGPCRALLADLSGGNAQRMSVANSMFSLFMAVGNVLGYAAGSYTHLYRIFTFSKTEACDIYCSNLKSCFFISVVLILTIHHLLVAAIALGVQFVSALQFSLLTPYVQLIGIPHNLAPFIWLLGPILGLLVQPVVGYHSDNYRSRFGRRSPFIATGAALVAVSIFIIGYYLFVVNNLPKNSPPLELHCFSKDDELGYHRLLPGQEFSWSFCASLFKRTLFACHLWWGKKDVAFEAFYEDGLDSKK